MKRRRVKITGIGPVTPAGIGKEAFWKGILEPVSRVRAYRKLGDEMGPFVAAQVPAFEILRYCDRSIMPKGVARQTQFAVAGAILALTDAGLSTDALSELGCVVISGSSIMDFSGILGSIQSVAKSGVRGAKPRVLFTSGIGSVASTIRDVLGINLRTVGISNQCNSGLDAVGYAAKLIADGDANIAICGGAEAPLGQFPILELRAAELTPHTVEMPEQIARPFDLWRTTGVVSEGACMFILEPEESPRRGYCYVSGYSFGNDSPGDLCGGMVEAGRMAIAEAGLRPAHIEALNAWGPGHSKVDSGEADAMQRLFGEALDGIPVVSIKGAIGTPLGAAPAIQIGAAALAQQHSIIPPTVNWQFPDPLCRLNLSSRARSISHSSTLINSHGLGSVNSCIVIQRC